MDIKSGTHVDLDEREGLQSIEDVFYHDGKFYILANKRKQKLGFYLLSFDTHHPEQECQILVAWNHMLDIADADIQLLVASETGLEEDVVEDADVELTVKKKYTSIVVSFKMIGINTFNVFVIDLDTKLIKYWHESYQLWESKVKGFLLSSNEFMILSKDGINVIMLGEKKPRVLKDKDGQIRLLHSLGEMNYLKIEPTGHVYFSCQFYHDRQVCLQEQYQDMNNNT